MKGISRKNFVHFFRFVFMGMMTQLGTWHGVWQAPTIGGKEGPNVALRFFVSFSKSKQTKK